VIKRIINKVKFISLQARVEAFDQFKKIAPFDQLDDALMDRNKEMLCPYYAQYVNEISSADMAASLELAAFLYGVCKLREYTKVLDLGSGLSSFVLRLYASETSGVQVYSVDDDPAWLLKTKVFLERHQLDVSNLLTVNQFFDSNESGFDCILHDLNFVEVRINYIDKVIALAKQNGLIILDDVHKPDYRYQALKIVERTASRVYSLEPVTIDNYYRYSYGVVKG